MLYRVSALCQAPVALLWYILMHRSAERRADLRKRDGLSTRIGFQNSYRVIREEISMGLGETASIMMTRQPNSCRPGYVKSPFLVRE
ncbi:hypothetical protein F5Y12DRAFT_775346 [Xylaria sp. FL1777]|nr:hypothetical protein F5Y12DRAFT_775346 [Xylaria sp. FL1777]